MKIENINGVRALYPNDGYMLYSQKLNTYFKEIYLGKYDNLEDYVEVHIDDIEGYEPKKEVDKINKKIKEMEDENINMLSTTFELDFRIFELECFLEDNKLLSTNKLSINKLERGKRNMALSQYEIAKKLILLGEYDEFNMKYKLERYKDRGVITEEQYNELMALMDLNDMMNM